MTGAGEVHNKRGKSGDRQRQGCFVSEIQAIEIFERCLSSPLPIKTLFQPATCRSRCDSPILPLPRHEHSVRNPGEYLQGLQGTLVAGEETRKGLNTKEKS
jgi:hypothetical protein